MVKAQSREVRMANRIGRILLLLFLLFDTFDTSAFASNDVESPEQAHREVRFDSLKDAVLTGRIGRPVGTLCEIEGIWQRSTFSRSTFLFHVISVEGKMLDSPVVYLDKLVVNASGLPEGAQTIPVPKSGDMWKLRMYECWKFCGTPRRLYKEAVLREGANFVPFASRRGQFDKPFELTSMLFYDRVPEVGEQKESNRTNKGSGEKAVDRANVRRNRGVEGANGMSFEDLAAHDRVIGRLGREIGRYYTIRGVWHTSLDRKGFVKASLHITMVDGRPAEDDIVYPEGAVLELSSSPSPEWRRPKQGEVWELRVVETLMHWGAPKGFASVADPIGSELADGCHLESVLTYHREPKVIHRPDKGE